jgi:hypothetical protein
MTSDDRHGRGRKAMAALVILVLLATACAVLASLAR